MLDFFYSLCYNIFIFEGVVSVQAQQYQHNEYILVLL